MATTRIQSRDEEIETLTRVYQTECRHWTGIQNEICKAGVVYLSVRDMSVIPARFPCIHPGCAVKCDKLDRLTPEEARQQAVDMEDQFDMFLSKINSRVCPTCDTEWTGQRQVGKYVYLEPCGHRLGQGKAVIA